jgi:hypothetical protein
MNIAYKLTLRRIFIVSRSINRIKMASPPERDQIKSPGSGGKRARDAAIPEIEDCGFESDELPEVCMSPQTRTKEEDMIWGTIPFRSPRRRSP